MHKYTPTIQGELFLWVCRSPVIPKVENAGKARAERVETLSQLLYNHCILIPGYLQSCLKTVSAEMGWVY